MVGLGQPAAVCRVGGSAALRPLPAQHGGRRGRRLLVSPPEGPPGRRPARGLRQGRLRLRPREAGRAEVGAEDPPQLLTDMTNTILAVPGSDTPRAYAPPAAARVLTPREFRLFQALIQREAGIHLSDAKKVLVEGRLARRLRELGLDFADYYGLVEADPQERVRMLDCICTNET